MLELGLGRRVLVTGGGRVVHDEAAEARALQVVVLDAVELLDAGSIEPRGDGAGSWGRGHDDERLAELTVDLRAGKGGIGTSKEKAAQHAGTFMCTHRRGV